MQNNLEHLKLLTIAEVQAILSIGRTRVFQLIGSGELKSVQVGSLRRIPVSALHEFIEELCNVSGLWNLKEGSSNRTD